MIEITPHIFLDEKELELEFIRAAGPGGQKVNKVSTAVQLRFDAARSPSLPEDVRRRLIKLAGSRVSAEGIVVMTARRHRTQSQNRQEAIERLVSLIRRAAQPPKPRKRTRPSQAARERRLEAKRRQSEKKRLRRPPEP